MRIIKLISFLLITPVFMILVACTNNPYTGEAEAGKIGIGAGLGATGGAIAGQLIGHNTTATLIGAAVGAGLGGAVGNYMDQQATALRQQLRGTGVSVSRQGNNIQLVMQSDVTFALNSADIQADFYPTLNSVSLVLKKYRKTVIRVAGYTDNTGSASYNQDLSERRAQSVAHYLINQGVTPGRFSVVGYGSRYPIASNGSSAGRGRNRRVEITLQSM